MHNLALFVDGSVNPQSSIGGGACLFIEETVLIKTTALQLTKAFTSRIKTQRFAQTSSTKLELEALLWALSLAPKAATLTVYTDCQNIMRLPQRKQHLQAKNFCNKKGEKLPLASLYQLFYKQHDLLGFDLVKLKGHKPQAEKSLLDSVFSLVDNKARTACREYNAHL